MNLKLLESGAETAEFPRTNPLPQLRQAANNSENRSIIPEPPANISESIIPASHIQNQLQNTESGNVPGHEETVTRLEISRNQNSEIAEIIDQCVCECRQKNISDPVDILKLCQSKIVTGRTLDIVNDSDVLRRNQLHPY